MSIWHPKIKDPERQAVVDDLSEKVEKFYIEAEPPIVDKFKYISNCIKRAKELHSLSDWEETVLLVAVIDRIAPMQWLINERAKDKPEEHKQDAIPKNGELQGAVGSGSGDGADNNSGEKVFIEENPNASGDIAGDGYINRAGDGHSSWDADSTSVSSSFDIHGREYRRTRDGVGRLVDVPIHSGQKEIHTKTCIVKVDIMKPRKPKGKEEVMVKAGSVVSLISEDGTCLCEYKRGDGSIDRFYTERKNIEIK